MESITIKVSDEMAAEIEKAMKPHYSTKTEFIRGALRERLRRELAWKEFFKFYGKAKKQVSDEELEKNREIALKQLAKENGWSLD